MVYNNNDPMALMAMENERLSDTEPEAYGECAACGDDIYIGDRYYEYGYKMYCKDCFKEVLFDELADEYREEAGAA